MNIFYLDDDPKLAAEYHCDKHVVKMILESAQMLSTAHHVLDGEIGAIPNKQHLYKSTHVNHPCNVWIRSNIQHYNWLYELFQYLCFEYTNRYNKVHLTDTKLSNLLKDAPNNIPFRKLFEEPPQCMPEEYQVSGDTVQAYRNYYMFEKSEFAVWKLGNVPYWYSERKIKCQQ